MKPKILLLGTGQMAYEYARILKVQGYNFIVIGRGQDSAKIFQKKTGIIPYTGGAEKFLSQNDFSGYKAIVAVNGDQLGKVTLALIKNSIKTILVEKPGGIDAEEIKLINKVSQKESAKIYIAYNRRFYASVKKAQELIDKDGGISSFHFDFTELSNSIATLNHPDKIKNEWLLHNSSHVIDLAFSLGGKPKSITSHTAGFLDWHPKGTIFTGCGVSEHNSPFTYHANWLSAGRWGVEIMTKKHKLFLRPLEKLQIQQLSSFEVQEFDIDDKFDINYKPGIFEEVKSFLGNQQNLCTLSEQVENLKFYKNILNGNNT